MENEFKALLSNQDFKDMSLTVKMDNILSVLSHMPTEQVSDALVEWCTSEIGKVMTERSPKIMGTVADAAFHYMPADKVPAALVGWRESEVGKILAEKYPKGMGINVGKAFERMPSDEVIFSLMAWCASETGQIVAQKDITMMLFSIETAFRCMPSDQVLSSLMVWCASKTGKMVVERDPRSMYLNMAGIARKAFELMPAEQLPDALVVWCASETGKIVAKKDPYGMADIARKAFELMPVDQLPVALVRWSRCETGQMVNEKYSMFMNEAFATAGERIEGLNLQKFLQILCNDTPVEALPDMLVSFYGSKVQREKATEYLKEMTTAVSREQLKASTSDRLILVQRDLDIGDNNQNEIYFLRPNPELSGSTVVLSATSDFVGPMDLLNLRWQGRTEYDISRKQLADFFRESAKDRSMTFPSKRALLRAEQAILGQQRRWPAAGGDAAPAVNQA